MSRVASNCFLLAVFAGMLVAACPVHSAEATNTDAASTTLTNYFASSTEALGMLLQVVAGLEEIVRSKDLASIHSEDMVLAASMVAIQQQARRVDDDRREGFRAEVEKFAQNVAALHLAGDLQQQTMAEEKLQAVKNSLEHIKGCFKPAAAAAAEVAAAQWMCPSHRDIRGTRTDTCPKCGAQLDQRVRILPEFCGLPTPARQSMTAKIHTDKPLVPGQPVKGFLDLNKMDGSAVYPPDLIVAHTERIHLLIIDSSLTDYHHEHPQVSRVPGEYPFSFTPRKPGSYQAWVDVRPRPLGLQEYISTTVPATTTGEPLTDRTTTNRAVVDGLTFELSFTTDKLRTGRPAPGKLRITGPEGKPFTQLEPLMNAFVHLVGFHEDRKTVLHLHPKGALVTDTAARGGPEIEFQMFPPQSGFVRLFAQVQVGGVSKYAPFGLRIVP
jgi:hypothetical protein